MGVFKLGKVGMEDSKASANKHKVTSWGYANQLEAQLRREVRKLLRRAERAVCRVPYAVMRTVHRLSTAEGRLRG